MPKNDDNFGPILDGILLPETVILPPEVLTLLPWMSLAELKIVIAAVGRLMQVGGAEPITLSEFETLTGLDRKSVVAGIERALKRGLLIRYEISGYQGHTSYVYELKPRFIGGKFPPMTPIKAKQSKDVVVDIDSTTTDLTLLNLSADANFSQKSPENEQKNALFSRLRKIGIYAKSAHFLLDNYPLERIEKFLDLYPLAFRAGRAHGPGWLFKAITEDDWDPDLELEDLQQRQERETAAPEPGVDQPRTPKQRLPKTIVEKLREIGWSGDTTELVAAHQANRKRFRSWLNWAQTQPREYAAARFLNGLRSGIEPPYRQNYLGENVEW